MIELTPKLIYEDLYASAYKDLLMYGLSEDQSSRKANIYAVKNTWTVFTTEACLFTKLIFKGYK